MDVVSIFSSLRVAVRPRFGTWKIWQKFRRLCPVSFFESNSIVPVFRPKHVGLPFAVGPFQFPIQMLLLLLKGHLVGIFHETGSNRFESVETSRVQVRVRGA